jgi:hypothetical protein
VNKVLEVTRKESLTYIGYSRGTAQVFLALALDQDYYADKIDKVIALAPCMYLEMDQLRGNDAFLNYQGMVDFYEEKKANSEWFVNPGFGMPNSYQDLLFWDQINVADRPQMFIPLEYFSNGLTESTEIALSAIDRTEIVMIAGTDDIICTNTNAHRILSELGEDTCSVVRDVPGAGHLQFAIAGGERFTGDLIDSIEGRSSCVGEPIQAMSAEEMVTEVWDTYFSALGDILGWILLVLMTVLLCGCCLCCCLCCACCRCCCKKSNPHGDDYTSI